MDDSASPVSADVPPQPDGGWSVAVETVARARVIPPESSAMVQPCGVLRADGSHVEIAATWRGGKPMMTRPDAAPLPEEKLAGRHLWAGQIWMHFGHFMAESLSRTWALDHLKNAVDGIVFIPKRPGRSQALKGYQRDFFRLLGIDLPIRILEQPTEVEELVVPGQGFGLGAIAAGTAPFRAFFANRFARDVAPDGPEGLYLSRSALGGMEGGALHEEAIERSLARDGIETIHPQQMPLEAQIARYRAARRVVGLDGSALHLFGFVGRPDQRSAIILRRNSRVFQSIKRQITAFTGTAPEVFDAIAADWVPEHKSRPGRYSFGEIDFPVLARQMHAAGFGPAPEKWDIPRFRDMKRAMARFSAEKGVTFHRIRKPGRRAGRAADKAAS